MYSILFIHHAHDTFSEGGSCGGLLKLSVTINHNRFMDFVRVSLTEVEVVFDTVAHDEDSTDSVNQG